MLIMRFFDESSIIKGAVGRPRLTERNALKKHMNNKNLAFRLDIRESGEAPTKSVKVPSQILEFCFLLTSENIIQTSFYTKTHPRDHIKSFSDPTRNLPCNPILTNHVFGECIFWAFGKLEKK